MIRSGKFGDIPGIVGLMVEMHRTSRYRGCRLDLKRAKALTVQAIQRHGDGKGPSCVFVAVHDGAVEGFIIGAVAPLYEIAVELIATDVFFYVMPGRDQSHAGGLLNAFETWAKQHPAVVEIRMGVTDAIEDFKRVGKLYERRGYRLGGEMWLREIPKKQLDQNEVRRVA